MKCRSRIVDAVFLLPAAKSRMGEWLRWTVRSVSPIGSTPSIVCAQSFHWFDRSAAQVEFHRILKPGGKVVLVWNSRLTLGTAFLEEYNRLLHTFCPGYENVGHKISNETLSPFFRGGRMHQAKFPNRQVFDFEGLRGRLLSSSYAPVPGQPGYEPMMAELRKLFDQSHQDGKVFFDYETEVYWGEV